MVADPLGLGGGRVRWTSDWSRGSLAGCEKPLSSRCARLARSGVLPQPARPKYERRRHFPIAPVRSGKRWTCMDFSVDGRGAGAGGPFRDRPPRGAASAPVPANAPEKNSPEVDEGAAIPMKAGRHPRLNRWRIEPPLDRAGPSKLDGSWWALSDLNRGLPGYEPGALTAELRALLSSVPRRRTDHDRCAQTESHMGRLLAALRCRPSTKLASCRHDERG
jgi:hypothetical protein